MVVSSLRQAMQLSGFPRPYFSIGSRQSAYFCYLGVFGRIGIFKQTALGFRHSKDQLIVLTAVKSEFGGITIPCAGFRKNREIGQVDFSANATGFAETRKICGKPIAQIHHAPDQTALSQPYTCFAARFRYLMDP